MATTTRRPRSKRGDGASLRDDIVTAASDLLERTGRDDAVTLRAVARAVGITAPSIYRHFAGPKEIVGAVVARAFDELTAELRPAAAGESDPAARVFAVCRAYLAFAVDRPHLYRVLFQRQHSEPTQAITPMTLQGMVGAAAFGVLLDAVRDGVTSRDALDPQGATIRLWVALHGLATLRVSQPYFPWPPVDDLLDDLVTRLVDLPTAKNRIV